MLIDCTACEMEGSRHCRNCVVSAILQPRPEGAIVIDCDEERALRALAAAGLVPQIRMRRRAGAAPGQGGVAPPPPVASAGQGPGCGAGGGLPC